MKADWDRCFKRNSNKLFSHLSCNGLRSPRVMSSGVSNFSNDKSITTLWSAMNDVGSLKNLLIPSTLASCSEKGRNETLISIKILIFNFITIHPNENSLGVDLWIIVIWFQCDRRFRLKFSPLMFLLNGAPVIVDTVNNFIICKNHIYGSLKVFENLKKRNKNKFQDRSESHCKTKFRSYGKVNFF